VMDPFTMTWFAWALVVGLLLSLLTKGSKGSGHHH
jgi:hypothetical protein